MRLFNNSASGHVAPPAPFARRSQPAKLDERAGDPGGLSETDAQRLSDVAIAHVTLPIEQRLEGFV
jgi:hypothetical protein